jgi:hypothetical protein
MIDTEKEYLETRMAFLKNKMADTSNRIAIMLEKRRDLNKELKGIRSRLERAKRKEVSEW